LRINPEKKEERERITAALLRATLQLAAAHGFASLGLREVARAADIAPTSFYRHFADMEELGLALVEDGAGRLLRDWVARARSAEGAAKSPVAAILHQALTAAVEEPELLRFILAERFGAIPGFRAALETQIAVLKAAVKDALETELSGHQVPDFVADAVVVLMLEACGQAVNRGQEQMGAIRDTLLRQIRALMSGVARGNGAP
jgi:AcrR family transcriptional regulator